MIKNDSVVAVYPTHTEAESAIGAGTPYAAASSAAGIAIGKLKRAVI